MIAMSNCDIQCSWNKSQHVVDVDMLLYKHSTCTLKKDGRFSIAPGKVCVKYRVNTPDIYAINVIHSDVRDVFFGAKLS